MMLAVLATLPGEGFLWMLHAAETSVGATRIIRSITHVRGKGARNGGPFLVRPTSCRISPKLSHPISPSLSHPISG